MSTQEKKAKPAHWLTLPEGYSLQFHDSKIYPRFQWKNIVSKNTGSPKFFKGDLNNEEAKIRARKWVWRFYDDNIDDYRVQQ